jgi:hypothetical protein
MAKSSGSGVSSFVSKSNLKTGAERFLSQVVAHFLATGLRTHDDFLRSFPPLDLMRGLDSAPDLRGSILTKAVGFHERIARKKSAESAAEDLRIALEENVTTAADILSLLSDDDRVRYLDRPRLFAFAIDPGFFAGAKPSDIAINTMVFLLETALGEEVLSLADIADGISFETISRSLPPDELARVVLAALEHGRKGAPLDEARLLDVVPLATLVRHVPLEKFWTEVVLAKVAGPAGWLKGGSIPPAPERPKNEPAKEAKSASTAKPAAAVPPATPPKPAPRTPNEATTSNPEVDALIEAEPAGAEEDVARRRVMDRLTAINRLPLRHADLSTQILFSIDSMYQDLSAAPSDDEREEAIRDAFPNEQHMATALLALIELLEPSIDIKDPEIAKADIDSLINVFLIEERDHREGSSPRPSTGAPGAPLPPQRRSAPPPLPRAASPVPPPLPGGADKAR